MTPHEKLNLIQNIVYEILEGGERWKGGDLHPEYLEYLANTKSQLQEILYVIEQVNNGDEQVHGI